MRFLLEGRRDGMVGDYDSSCKSIGELTVLTDCAGLTPVGSVGTYIDTDSINIVSSFESVEEDGEVTFDVSWDLVFSIQDLKDIASQLKGDCNLCELAVVGYRMMEGYAYFYPSPEKGELTIQFRVSCDRDFEYNISNLIIGSSVINHLIEVLEGKTGLDMKECRL